MIPASRPRVLAWLVALGAIASNVGPAIGSDRIALIETRADGPHLLDLARAEAILGQPADELRRRIQDGRLALQRGGAAVPLHALPDGRGFVFDAPVARDRHLGGAVFVLGPGAVPALPVEDVPPSAGVPAGVGLVTRWFETNRTAILNLSDVRADDLWLGDNFLGSHPVLGARTNQFVLERVAPEAGGGRLTIELASNSDTVHRFGARLNGVEVGTTQWSGRVRMKWEIPLGPGFLREGTNVLVLESRGERVSLAYLDRFGVRYPRGLTVDAAPVVFEVDGPGPVEVAFNGSGGANLWRRAPDGTVARIGIPDGALRAGFRGEPGFTYLAFGTGPLPEPVSWVPVTPVDWRRLPGARYVVVAADSLMPSAQSLAEFRRGQGLSALAVPWGQIRAEFGQGIADPLAIRAFLREAIRTWTEPPAYVVLLGDGTHDYLDSRGLNDNLIPPDLIWTSFGWAASDIGLGDLDGDGIPEVAVGRVPVTTADAMAGWMDRLRAYEAVAQGGRAAALYLAGRPDDAGHFDRDSAAAAAGLGPGWQTALLADLSLELAEARAALRQALAAGVSFWNYVGHGARDRLGNGYVEVADVAGLEFGGVAPVFAALTCSVGQFNVPGAESLGEALLLRSRNGPVAVWSPSGFSFNVQAHVLNLALSHELASSPRGRRMGDLVRSAIAGFHRAGGEPTTPLFYNLLGDPATVLAFGVDPVHPEVSVASDGPSSMLILTVSGTPRTTYVLESGADPVSGPWASLGPVETDETGGARRAVEPAGSARFFRIGAR